MRPTPAWQTRAETDPSGSSVLGTKSPSIMRGPSFNPKPSLEVKWKVPPGLDHKPPAKAPPPQKPPAQKQMPAKPKPTAPDVGEYVPPSKRQTKDKDPWPTFEQELQDFNEKEE